MISQQEIVFIGYSGHALVCIDVALNLGLKIAGYCDVVQKEFNPYQLEYLGTEDNLHLGVLVFVGIGNNNIRQKIHENMKFLNFDFQTLIHPSATFSSTVEIGENTLIAARAIINPLAKVGIGCIINSGAIIEHECEIQDFAHIGPGAVLAGNVSIGERTFIGANASVKQGISICADVTVGIGSVVIKDITQPGIYVGAPAKLLNK